MSSAAGEVALTTQGTLAPSCGEGPGPGSVPQFYEKGGWYRFRVDVACSFR